MGCTTIAWRCQIPGLVAGLAIFAVAAGSAAQQVPPHPRDIFGFEPGTDYKLADYDQMLAYYRALDAESDRVQVEEIGRSVLGRPLLLVVISSEENIHRLENYRQISERLARARNLDDAEARRLAKEGKAVVWIDSGLHSTEVGHAQHAPLLAHAVATEETEEMRRIRENVILLLMPVMNPDGLDIVADWYHSNVGTPFETANLPVLYHFYVGHDNNRDWAMILQPETRAVSAVVYHQWFPHLMYNHHQTGPFPARIEIPPFYDPVNPTIDPLIVRSVNLVGTYMAKRFEEEGKPGVVSHRQYDMWRADGMRYPAYGHNIVAVHSETALYRYATPRYYPPESLPTTFGGRGPVVSTREPSIFYANPWRGGWWRMRDAMEYMLTGDMAVLDIAARLKEHWLYNKYQLGRAAIEEEEAARSFAYVIPSAQWDVGEAVELVNVLRRGGAEVWRATAPFTADSENYSPGSYIVPAAQHLRSYLRLLLEKQVYPDRRVYPGGPPDPPYDVAGWTLPMAMGVELVAVDEPFQAMTEPVGTAALPTGQVADDGGHGYLLTRRRNQSALAVNRLLAEGEQVSWAGAAFEVAGTRHEAGTIVIESRRGTAERLRSLTNELGLDFAGAAEQPPVRLYRLRRPRVGLYKSWVANMDEGWVRWLLEQYDFVVDTLHDADVRTGDLAGYDAIVLPDQDERAILNGHLSGTMPAPYVGGLGAEGAAALKRFVEQGGTLIALDRASEFAIRHFGLPLRNPVATLGETEFFIPGSLVRLAVDTSHPLAYGTQPEVAAYFVESRAFDVIASAQEGEWTAPPQPVEVVARYADSDLLMSGWEIGAQRHIADKAAIVRVGLGEGDVVLVGFRPQFRGYPRATLKFLFNALHGSVAELPRPGSVAEADIGA